MERDGERVKMNEDTGPGETVSPVIVKLVEEISICACEIERLEKENAELKKENEKLHEFNRNQASMIKSLKSLDLFSTKTIRNEVDKNYALYALAIKDAANKRKLKTTS
jgi:hypothetical protein